MTLKQASYVPAGVNDLVTASVSTTNLELMALRLTPDRPFPTAPVADLLYQYAYRTAEYGDKSQQIAWM